MQSLPFQMSDPFTSLLSSCNRQIARSRELSSVSFEYTQYIRTKRIDELVSHPEFLTVRNHALCYAAGRSSVDVMKTLINHGADFTTGDALREAAHHGNMAAVKFLVEVVKLPVHEKHIYATYYGDHTDIQDYLAARHVPE